jgi:PRC-barrel domain
VIVGFVLLGLALQSGALASLCVQRSVTVTAPDGRPLQVRLTATGVSEQVVRPVDAVRALRIGARVHLGEAKVVLDRTSHKSVRGSLPWFARRPGPASVVVVSWAEGALETRRENDMTDAQDGAQWNVAEWQGKMLFDRDGEKIGKLQDVYVDVETDEPQFATVKEGFIGRHLTFVPLGGIQISPDGLQVAVTKEQVRSAPNIELQGDELSQADESTLYHHFELNYTPISTESGRRLARR